MTVSPFPSAAIAHPAGTAVPPLWQVNPDSDPVESVSFAMEALEAMDTLLETAVTHGEMAGSMAWVVQHLMHAREAALDHAQTTAGVNSERVTEGAAMDA